MFANFAGASHVQDRHALRAVLERRAQRPRPARSRDALRPEIHRLERPDVRRHLRLLHRQPDRHDRQGAVEQLLAVVPGHLGRQLAPDAEPGRARRERVRPVVQGPDEFPDALDIKFGFGDKIAPRLGFAYDIKGDGKWKAYGSLGDYYDITKLELPRGSFGGDNWVELLLTLDTLDYGSIQCGEGTRAARAGSSSRRLPPQLEPDRSRLRRSTSTSGHDRHRPEHEAGQGRRVTVGIEHELTRAMSVGVRYVHKWLVPHHRGRRHLLPGSARSIFISNPGEGLAATLIRPSVPSPITPKLQREYDGLEFRLNKRFSNNWSGWQLHAQPPVWQLLGPGELGRERPRQPEREPLFDDMIMATTRTASRLREAEDRPSAQVQAQRRLRLQVGHDGSAPTGSSRAASRSRTNMQLAASRCSRTAATTGRTPMFSQLDLNINQEMPLPGHSRAQVRLNIENVFDQDDLDELLPDHDPGTLDVSRQPDGGHAAGRSSSRTAFDMNALLAATPARSA